MTAPEPDRAELVARAAVVALENIGPNRIRWLLGGGSALAALDDLRAGRLTAPPGGRRPSARPDPRPPGLTDDLIRKWEKAARGWDLAALDDQLRDLGVGLMGERLPRWPFVDEPEPPLVVFHRGRPEALDLRPRVAMVGTRRCSAVGRQVAFTFARDLAAAGAAVVSGLASGIDGAAHRGALAAGGVTIGVAGTGINRPYPASNRRLWEEVVASGLVFTEAPLGAGGERWRFPARNRLIAALADVVIVVESHHRGGALLTASEAADRGVPVMAVPGAVTSPASAGTNQLLVEGCPPACAVADILDLLGHRPPPAAAQTAGRRRSARLALVPPVPADRPGPASLPFPPAEGGDPAGGGLGSLGQRIVAEVQAGATPVEVLVAVTGAGVPAVLAEIQRLVAEGRVVLDGSTVIYA